MPSKGHLELWAVTLCWRSYCLLVALGHDLEDGRVAGLADQLVVILRSSSIKDVPLSPRLLFVQRRNRMFRTVLENILIDLNASVALKVQLL